MMPRTLVLVVSYSVPSTCHVSRVTRQLSRVTRVNMYYKRLYHTCDVTCHVHTAPVFLCPFYSNAMIIFLNLTFWQQVQVWLL